jgi:hypothetical protein
LPNYIVNKLTEYEPLRIAKIRKMIPIEYQLIHDNDGDPIQTKLSNVTLKKSKRRIIEESEDDDIMLEKSYRLNIQNEDSIAPNCSDTKDHLDSDIYSFEKVCTTLIAVQQQVTSLQSKLLNAQQNIQQLENQLQKERMDQLERDKQLKDSLIKVKKSLEAYYNMDKHDDDKESKRNIQRDIIQQAINILSWRLSSATQNTLSIYSMFPNVKISNYLLFIILLAWPFISFKMWQRYKKWNVTEYIIGFLRKFI